MMYVETTSSGEISLWETAPVISPNLIFTDSPRMAEAYAAKIISAMPKYKPIITIQTTRIDTNSDLDKRWEKIISLAGAFEGDEALTVEKLYEFREMMWGDRLDGIDDLTEPIGDS